MDTNNTEESSFTDSEISLPRTVRLWILLIFNSSSTVCSIYLLYYLITNRNLRQSISNHVIVILLLMGLTTQLIDVPLYITFILKGGRVTPATSTTCIFWWVASFAMYNGGTIFMAWASLERYLIVFYNKYISNVRGRFFLHYLPIAILLAYVFIFYIYVLLFFPCENVYDYSLPFCDALPCYQEDPFIGVWEFTINNIVPNLLIGFLSIILFVRVIQQKRRLNQQVHWRKHRRMVFQLAAISSLNIVINVPLNLISLARLCGLPEDYGVDAQHYFYFLCYFVIFLFPFLCLISYPELWKKKRWRICRRKTRVQPIGQLSVWATHRREH